MDENDNELNVQIYSKNPIALESNFVIPGDPYESMDARLFLKSIGVIFYRDEYHSNGIVIHQEDVQFPFNGFYSQGVFDKELMQISQWNEGPREGEESWILRNTPTPITQVTPEGVQGRQ